MKTILLFAVILFVFSAESQINLPFPDSTGSWVYTDAWYGGPWDPDVYFPYREYVGDTISLDTTIYREVVHSNSPYITDTLQYDERIGYYRIDSLKVYFVPESDQLMINGVYVDSTELLLYDFGMGPGDTINYNLNTWEFLTLVLDSIDTVQFNGTDYRRFNFQTYGGIYLPYGTYWIEGMGSRDGFFPWFAYFENDHFLHCFHENGEALEFNLAGGSSCWDIPLKIPEAYLSHTHIYPNPAEHSITIESDAEIRSYRILDLSGRIIASGELNKPVLNVESYTSGHYYVELINDLGEKFTEKVIIK